MIIWFFPCFSLASQCMDVLHRLSSAADYFSHTRQVSRFSSSSSANPIDLCHPNTSWIFSAPLFSVLLISSPERLECSSFMHIPFTAFPPLFPFGEILR